MNTIWNAVEKGDLDGVKFFLKKKDAYKEKRDRAITFYIRGENWFTKSTGFGKSQVIDSPWKTFFDHEDSILHQACRKDHTKIVSFLIEHYPILLKQKNYYNLTALFWSGPSCLSLLVKKIDVFHKSNKVINNSLYTFNALFTQIYKLDKLGVTILLDEMIAQRNQQVLSKLNALSFVPSVINSLIISYLDNLNPTDIMIPKSMIDTYNSYQQVKDNSDQMKSVASIFESEQVQSTIEIFNTILSKTTIELKDWTIVSNS